MELIFGTHNLNKVKEINKLLPPNFAVKSLTDLNYYIEIEESGKTLEENALIKAKTIFNTFKKNCFSDDSGLEVFALGGKPEFTQPDMRENKKIQKPTRKKSFKS